MKKCTRRDPNPRGKLKRAGQWRIFKKVQKLTKKIKNFLKNSLSGLRFEKFFRGSIELIFLRRLTPLLDRTDKKRLKIIWCNQFAGQFRGHFPTANQINSISNFPSAALLLINAN